MNLFKTNFWINVNFWKTLLLGPIYWVIKYLTSIYYLTKTFTNKKLIGTAYWKYVSEFICSTMFLFVGFEFKQLAAPENLASGWLVLDTIYVTVIMNWLFCLLWGVISYLLMRTICRITINKSTTMSSEYGQGSAFGMGLSFASFLENTAYIPVALVIKAIVVALLT